MSPIEGWEEFYLIVGGAAGALIGLQFVVMTLIAEMPISRAAAQSGGAYTTPSVIHFGVVLFLSALVSAPWGGIAAVAVLWGVVGLIGIGYIAIVARRIQRQPAYQAVFEDWLFHVLLPAAAYALLVLSALLAYAGTRPALFLVGAAVLLLLFVGIHNAWDLVTYHVFVRRQNQSASEQDD